VPGQPIQVGPFIGGLNTFSDDTSIADNELVLAENWDLDLDGSLVSRPPFADNGIALRSRRPATSACSATTTPRTAPRT
jgi:hypothetical protein